jgi:two-component system NarL family sensor kinase
MTRGSRRLTAERQLSLVEAITRAIAESSDVAGVCGRVIELVCEILDLKTGWAFLLDPETAEPRLVAQVNLPPAFDVEPERWEGMCLCTQALIEGSESDPDNIGVVRCSRLWRLEPAESEGLRFHASVPLYSRGVQMGILNFAAEHWGALSGQELRLLGIVAGQLAVVIDRERLLAEREAAATSEERARMARDLHDTLIQGATGISLRLEAADAVFASSPTAAREQVHQALALSQGTIAEARRALAALAPASLRDDALLPALRQLVEDFAKTPGISIAATLPRREPDLEDGPRVSLYRAVSEGLHNVVKHSAARIVRLEARVRGGRLSVVLADDGRGFDPARGSGGTHAYGMHSMRRRIRMAGGSFRVRTAPGQGTILEMSVPLKSR